MTTSNKEILSVREKLSQANMFLEVPEEAMGNTNFIHFLEGVPKKFVDVNKINLVLSRVVLEDPKGWESINPNMELLEAGDVQEINRVNVGISKRKIQMQKALKEEVGFQKIDNKYALIFRGCPIESDNTQSNAFVTAVSNSRVVQEITRAWSGHLAENEGAVLAIGTSTQKINPKIFRILSVDVQESTSVEMLDQISWSILRLLASEVSYMARLEKEQQGLEMPRDQFAWASNPFIAEFRSAASEIINGQLSKIKSEGVTEFDLVTQVMMHLGIYEPSAIWSGNSELINDVHQLLKEEKGDEAVTRLHAAIESGDIKINEDLARYECERQASKLVQHYQTLSVTIDGREVGLPAQYMGNPDLNPFKEYEKTEINAKDRQYEIDQITGEKMMVVFEKSSGKKIIFKSVRPEISRLYSLGFSNLHYAREGEMAVYGAYLEGDEFPFAYSSYTPVTRQYSRDMLSYLGTNPDNIMESARAWNCSWSPENTMSVLFTYSHEMLKEQRESDIAAGRAREPLEGVFTSINPNPGFKAVSFRGVRFNVVGMKPTGFSYIRNDEGSADFMPKGEIKKLLGVDSDDDLSIHPRYVVNSTPFLPTLEMLAIFNFESEKELLKKPIYRVTNEAFQKN